MIPLSVFLLIWVVLLGLYAILSFVSIIQMIRFAVASSMTYFSTAVFLIIALIALIATGIYLSTVDWSLGLPLGSIFQVPTATL